MDAELTTSEPDTDWRRYDDINLTPILAAALDALQEHGYHGTTVRDIANRAGITMPSLYYHHGNKEGILLALLTIAMDDVLMHVEGGLVEAGTDCRSQLAKLVTAVVMHNTHRRDLAKLHPEFRFLGDQARRDYIGKRAAINDRFVHTLEVGNAEGVFRVDDTHVTARALLNMLNGICEWYQPDRGATPDQIATAYVQLALRMADAPST